MVLLGPFVRDVGANAFLEMLLKVMFARPWGAAAWGMYYNNLYPTQKPDDFAAYLDNLKTNLGEPGRLEALQQMLAASKHKSEVRLPQVQAPVLILMGTHDPDFKEPQQEAEWVAQQVSAAHTTW